MSIRTFSELPDLLTAGEVAAVLGKGRNWPYDAVQSGDLRAIRIGRSFRIPKGEVERYVRSLVAPNEQAPD